MTDFERADENYLEINEQDAAMDWIKEFFSSDIPVEIDGKVIEPRFDRIDFYGLDLQDFAMQAERRRVNLANGRVGVIMSYPTGTMPQKVQLTWSKFSRTLKNVELILIAMDKIDRGQFSIHLTENTYLWENPGIAPLPDVVTTAAEIPPLPTWENVPIATYACALLAILVALCGIACSSCKESCYRVAMVLVVASGVTFPFVRVSIPVPNAKIPLISDTDAEEVFAKLQPQPIPCL